METNMTNSQLGSQLSIVVDNNLQNAWHLLTLVHATGRPIRLTELASRYKFLQFTLVLIKSLCSIPDSPLFLTPDRVVSIRGSAFVAFSHFLWYLRSGFAVVPRNLRYVVPKRSLANITKVYFRKRKRNVAGLVADVGEFAEMHPPISLDISPETQTMSAKKLKPNDVEKGLSEGKRVNSIETDEILSSTFLKNQVQPKALPTFECFTVEEEEGSGGYGTVYKAKRNYDGVTLALKCPHSNAKRRYIQNEQKMLEQFGGKNFIIKYEGSFKYGNDDCLVLQHVEHERPEVLKKEIDLFQLQWYGYCLFRALASLHRQGVTHRDVKPGNFLFSRMMNKGYLVDFNLAIDTYKKYGTTGLKHVPFPSVESIPPAKARKVSNANALEAPNQEAERGSVPMTLTKNFKRNTNQTKLHEGYMTKPRITGADGSGMTSAKNGTSTKVLSEERLKEPVPCQGRKELISLAQKAMHGPNHKVASPPTSKRKRIAAPPERVDSNIIYPTPMPLHSSGVAIAGAGFIRSRGKVKNKKEGPCVGTKGFRAPEVLLKSPFQGPKLDVWSAGVTLVYLSTGRSPFLGDPDQNIMDIAKLRGAEELWEVAKLHNRESSFPAQLLGEQYLPSKKLCDWFGLYTRRPKLLKDLSWSFFDLVDKCLTVNPRLRISAEDALKHEFFAPCHEQLRQQRLRRHRLGSNSATGLYLDTQPQSTDL